METNINAESSKKKHIIDLDLAMGNPMPIPSMPGIAIGTLVISKSRRGASGKPIHIKYDYLRSIVEEIGYDRYQELKKLVPLQINNTQSAWKRKKGGGENAPT